MPAKCSIELARASCWGGMDGATECWQLAVGAAGGRRARECVAAALAARRQFLASRTRTRTRDGLRWTVGQRTMEWGVAPLPAGLFTSIWTALLRRQRPIYKLQVPSE